MKSRFFPDGLMKDDSIVNYYVLPLLGMNKKDFGDNFESAMINKEGTTVYVKVISDIYSESLYENKIQVEDNLFLYYDIPENFHADMQLIIKGEYSKLSDEAKGMIIEYSGLLYHHRVGDELFTSKLLFALDRDPALREYYYHELKTDPSYDKGGNWELFNILDEVELMEKITEEDFIENMWD